MSDQNNNSLGQPGDLDPSSFKVLRTSGEIDSGWQIADSYVDHGGNAYTKVIKSAPDGKGILEKTVSTSDFHKWNETSAPATQPGLIDRVPQSGKEAKDMLDDAEEVKLQKQAQPLIERKKALERQMDEIFMNCGVDVSSLMLRYARHWMEKRDAQVREDGAGSYAAEKLASEAYFKIPEKFRSDAERVLSLKQEEAELSRRIYS